VNIALDYDGTYDRDPELWEAFIRVAQSRGHKIMCVTKREPTLGTPGCSVPAIFSSRKAKIPAAIAQGFHPDIWIDDSPGGILFNDGAQVQVSG
jgi:hypothetical protein